MPALPMPALPDIDSMLAWLGADREAVWLPLYEAKMMHHFDHRWATYDGSRIRDVSLLEKQKPDFVVLPRYWVPGAEVVARSAMAPRELCNAWRARDPEKSLAALVGWWCGELWNKGKGLPQELAALAERQKVSRDKARKLARKFPLREGELAALDQAFREGDLFPGPQVLALAHELITPRVPRFLVGWRDIARSTDERTVIAGVLPWAGVGHTLPLKIINNPHISYVHSLICNLATFTFDYIGRQSLGSTHLTFFIYKQLPVLTPSAYARPCPWSPELTLADWLHPRVLELTYTAWDLTPFARELGYWGPPFPWDDERRFQIRCELDAAYFHLYGLSRDDAAYILDTFPIVKRKEEERFGAYRTKIVILEIYDALTRAMQTGRPYVSPLSPPPGAHAYEEKSHV